MSDDLAVLVNVPGIVRSRPSRPNVEVRICECCTTVLSRYNPTPWCSIHESEVRRSRRIYGGLMPHGTVLRDIEFPVSDRPLFRCDGCEHAWPIGFQWLTAHHRFCAWCKPTQAVRSDALELAS